MRFTKGPRRRGGEEARQPSKNKALYLAVGVGIFLICLLLSFYMTFPDQILRQRLVHELESRSPIRADLKEATLQPIMTVVGQGLSVRMPGQQQTLFQVDNFSVGPQWLKLLSGDPGLTGEIGVSAGELSFSWQASGQLAASARSLPLDIPLATNPATRFSGELESAEIITSAPLQDVTESRFDLDFNQVSLKGLEALTANADGLLLGKVSLQISGQGNSFSVTRLETSGGDLVASGSGTLMLVSANPQHSRINLNLSVRAGNQADPTLTSLLQLVGSQQADGRRKIRLTGTLAKPVAR